MILLVCWYSYYFDFWRPPPLDSGKPRKQYGKLWKTLTTWKTPKKLQQPGKLWKPEKLWKTWTNPENSGKPEQPWRTAEKPNNPRKIRSYSGFPGIDFGLFGFSGNWVGWWPWMIILFIFPRISLSDQKILWRARLTLSWKKAGQMYGPFLF